MRAVVGVAVFLDHRAELLSEDVSAVVELEPLRLESDDAALADQRRRSEMVQRAESVRREANSGTDLGQLIGALEDERFEPGVLQGDARGEAPDPATDDDHTHRRLLSCGAGAPPRVLARTSSFL